LASGAPLFSGIIAGIIGGIVVGLLSGSELSVSGPAAGLTAIVLTAITTLGGFEIFLVAVMLAGVLQIVLGLLKAGTLSNYFPSNVIEGMLTAIGIIIIIKQLLFAFGIHIQNEGKYIQFDEETEVGFLSHIMTSISQVHLGATVITLVSLAILIAFQQIPFLKKIKVIPGALVAVVAGVLLNELFIYLDPYHAVPTNQLVGLPVAESFDQFLSQFSRPNFASITEPKVWIVAATIAAVASIETLLCIEASDKMDPLKRYSSTNRELFAQGAGNLLSGFLGGLPMTSVIVRTTANINSGGMTRVAAIAHGVFLLIAVVAIPSVLNKIPLACLAAILLMIGWKLASPSVFKHMWKAGHYQFIPFIVTLIAVVTTDLLRGIGIGLFVSVLYILRANLKFGYFFDKTQHEQGEKVTITLAQEVSFLNKAAIKQTLNNLPKDGNVVIDASGTFYIDHDVLELFRDFTNLGAKDKNIKVELVGFKPEYNLSDASKHVVSHK
jgi:MFS superfamily sulfate permease-like transporter